MGFWEQGHGVSDEWYTPPHVFEALGVRFDLDVAHPPFPTHSPCEAYFSEGGLEKEWTGFVWMNPPFGKRNALNPWLDKFFDHGNGIALTPDGTSAAWFWRAWARADLVLFCKRISFLRPDGSKGSAPASGTALWAAGDRACAALELAHLGGLGILAKRA